MKLRYTFSNIGKGNDLKTRKQAIHSTDEAAKAMKDMIITIGGVVNPQNPINSAVVWLLAHCYTRKLTDDYVEYHFYLIDWITRLHNKLTSQKQPKEK